jgi:hypothetical protein
MIMNEYGAMNVYKLRRVREAARVDSKRAYAFQW